MTFSVKCLAGLLAAGLTLLPLPGAQAQFGGFHLPSVPKVPIPTPDIPVPTVALPGLSLPSLSDLTDNSPISSSFGDAVTAVPFLDDYAPTLTVPMAVMPSDPDGTFHLFRGAVFDFPAQSYCLHAGTYGPGHGEGYLYAPLKGPRSGMIQHILVRSVQHPEVEQHPIQELIWAILARAKFSDMGLDMQRTAATLLTPAEILDLNGSALRLVPDDARERLWGAVPGPVRQALDAENTIRGMVSSTVGATYDQIAAVAVLSGEPPPDTSPDVPRGRWSFLPEQGLFARYLPTGYSKTYEQVSVPGTRLVERDPQGRVSRITDNGGETLTVTYKASQTPPSAGSAHAWAFQTVTYAASSTANAVPEATWTDAGYAVTGTMPARWPGAPGASFIGLTARAPLEQGQWLLTLAALQHAGASVKPDSDDPDVQTLRDLSHLKAGLDDLSSGSTDDQPWSANAGRLVDEAWQDTFARIAASARPRTSARLSRKLSACPGDSGGSSYNPGGAAMPSDRSRQRLAQSPRPNVPFVPVGETPYGASVQAACAAHGIPAQDVAAYNDADGNTHYVVRLGGSDNHALPTQDAIAAAGTGGNEGAKDLLVFSVQQNGGQSRVAARTDDVSTGVVTSAGIGTTNGTDAAAVTQAANQALGNTGTDFGGHRP